MSVRLTAVVKSGTVWVRGINAALLFISVAEKEKWKFDHQQYWKVRLKVSEQNTSPKFILVLEMLYLPNRCGGYIKIQLGPCMRRGGRKGSPACTPACPGTLPTACSLLTQVLLPWDTKGSPHAHCSPPAGLLPLRTLHRLQHGPNLQQICLFGDHAYHSL